MTHICKPLFDRILVELIETPSQSSISGIIIPKTNDTPILQGTVIAIGDGRWNEDGDARIPVTVAVGDTVLFSRYGFDEVSIDSVLYYIGREDQLLAILENKHHG